MKIKLYKSIKGQDRLVDFGTINQIHIYRQLGYKIKCADNTDNQRLYKVVRSEFDALWATVPEAHKIRLRDLNSHSYSEETIEEKLVMLKAEITRIKRIKRTATYTRPKVTWRDRVCSFINTLIPAMEVNYAIA